MPSERPLRSLPRLGQDDNSSLGAREAGAEELVGDLAGEPIDRIRVAIVFLGARMVRATVRSANCSRFISSRPAKVDASSPG